MWTVVKKFILINILKKTRSQGQQRHWCFKKKKKTQIFATWQIKNRKKQQITRCCRQYSGTLGRAQNFPDFVFF